MDKEIAPEAVTVASAPETDTSAFSELELRSSKLEYMLRHYAPDIDLEAEMPHVVAQDDGFVYRPVAQVSQPHQAEPTNPTTDHAVIPRVQPTPGTRNSPLAPVSIIDMTDEEYDEWRANPSNRFAEKSTRLTTGVRI